MLMKLLKDYASAVNQLNEWVGRSVSWLTIALVVLICIDVAGRYAFGFASAALPELQWHLFALIFLFGAGYTLKHDRHVRVDVFYTKFPPKLKAVVDMLGSLLFLLPFCLLIMDASIPYIKMSFLINEESSDAGGLAYRFLIKGSIFVSFLLLMLQGTALFCTSLLTLIGDSERK